jgi:hypothetical protein
VARPSRLSRGETELREVEGSSSRDDADFEPAGPKTAGLDERTVGRRPRSPSRRGSRFRRRFRDWLPEQTTVSGHKTDTSETTRAVVSRRISTASTSPICRRKCVASDRPCTRVTPQDLHGKQGVCRGLPPIAGGPLATSFATVQSARVPLRATTRAPSGRKEPAPSCLGECFEL